MKKILLSLLILAIFVSSTPILKLDSSNGNKFAFNLLNSLATTNKNKNFVFSPYGIRNCFAFVYPGAAKNTKTEIKNTLLFDENPEEVLNSFQESNNNLRLCEASKLTIANSFWVKEQLVLKPSYLTLMKKTTTVNRLKNAAQVNKWVSDNTFGKITELVNEDEIEYPIVSLLVNTIALDAKWLSPFDTNGTRPEDFYIGNKTIKVPTMHSSIEATYLINDTITMLQLHYTDKISMIIAMPSNENVNFKWDDEMQQRLIGGHIMYKNSFIWQEKNSSIIVHLPKFKTSSGYNLIPTLKELGIMDAFSELKADFSQMNPDLYIGLIKQKAIIETTESGTSAAAATAIGSFIKSMPKDLYINKPFYFIIHHIVTGEILFMGKIVNPLEAN